jgi:RES domain-containing protein
VWSASQNLATEPALETFDNIARRFRPFAGRLWRVVADGADPVEGGRKPGRWNDGACSIIDTSADAMGACAEIHFHLSEGGRRPVGGERCRLFELRGDLVRALVIGSPGELAALGIDAADFGMLDYEEREREYAKTRPLARAAYLHGAQALVVPSARWSCPNVIVFADRVSPDALALSADLGLVDWDLWESRRAAGTPPRDRVAV